MTHQDFRGFEQIDLTFDPRVTVIASVNGVGESGIPHAMAGQTILEAV